VGRFAAKLATDWERMMAFLARNQTKRNARCSLVAIIIAHEAHGITKHELLPYVEYWHYRSEEWIDLVFPGYEEAMAQDGLFRTHFLAGAFSEFVAELESRCTWKYTGQPSVLLLSVVSDPAGSIVLDFNRVIDLDLVRALKGGTIESLQAFVETLIRVSKEHAGELSQNSLSDTLGASIFGKTMYTAVLKALKLEAITPLIGAVRDFRVKNRIAPRRAL
jgi:hypothetical protein